jgi:hypothetical protein
MSEMKQPDTSELLSGSIKYFNFEFIPLTKQNLQPQL